MPRYLVTGGCGFIGAHLTAALLARGSAVVVLDDLSTGCVGRLPETPLSAGLAATLQFVSSSQWMPLDAASTVHSTTEF